MPVSFTTLKKHNLLILEQPFTYNERYKSGPNKGKVKSKRRVQYNENHDSIYVDDQRKMAGREVVATPIYIRKGKLTVQDEDIRLLEVLRKHPDNGKRYKEVDVENDNLYQIKEWEALDRARTNIREADENTLRAAAVFLVNPSYIKKSKSDLIIKLRNVVENAANMEANTSKIIEKINNFFDEKSNEEKLMTAVAIKEDIIKLVAGKKMAWVESGEVIFIGSQSGDVMREFSLWMKTDEEGRQILSEISKMVKEKSIN